MSLNDELNNSTHSVERLDYQWVTNCEGCERNRSGPNLKYYTGIGLKGLSDDMKYLLGYRSPGRDLNLWPPDKHISRPCERLRNVSQMRCHLRMALIFQYPPLIQFTLTWNRTETNVKSMYKQMCSAVRMEISYNYLEYRNHSKRLCRKSNPRHLGYHYQTIPTIYSSSHSSPVMEPDTTVNHFTFWQPVIPRSILTYNPKSHYHISK